MERSGDGNAEHQLYGVPLDEFVATRTALARELAARGHKTEAARIKTLPKPSVPAWLVNQLFRTQAAAFATLVRAGTALQAAQLAVLRGAAREQLDSAGREESRAIADLTAHARTLLHGMGKPATAAAIERVTDTLRALSRSAAGASFNGRLVKELRPPGLEALLGAAEAAGISSDMRAAGQRRGAEKPRQAAAASEDAASVASRSKTAAAAALRRERAAAARQQELSRSREALAARRSEHTRATAALAETEAQHLAAERRVRGLEQELTQARDACQKAASELRRARDEERRLGRAARDAERAHEELEARLPPVED